MYLIPSTLHQLFIALLMWFKFVHTAFNQWTYKVIDSTVIVKTIEWRREDIMKRVLHQSQLYNWIILKFETDYLL